MLYTPDKHIIYRSQAEAIADEFWWSPGHFTGTKMGDAFCIAILVVIAVILWVKIYNHHKARKYFNKMAPLKAIAAYAVALLSSSATLYLAWFFIAE